ncbi:MAG: sensor histidine kinase [Deltaproteobacteria bacterium]|nr:sensor histidine kinase [Deltaproteobacteria bacterium]
MTDDSRTPKPIDEEFAALRSRVAELEVAAAERERESQALLEPGRQLRLVLDSAPVSIFAFDDRGIFTLHEGRAIAGTGMKPGDNVGVSAFALYDRLPLLLDTGVTSDGGTVLRRILAGETISAETELNGRIFDNQFVPLRDAEGRVVGGVGVATDITRRKQAELELASSRRRLRALNYELSLVEQRQQARLAERLHDDVAQNLALALLRLGELRSDATSPRLAGHLDDVRGLLEQAVAQIRGLTEQLEPPSLRMLGLEAALASLCDQFGRLHALPCRCVDEGGAKPLGEAIAGVLFRAVRELLMNVLKHAAARAVTVTMAREAGSIRLVVADDGVGFDPSILAEPRGFGLFSIQERLSHVGGGAVVESAPGRGTRVTLRAPLAAGA